MADGTESRGGALVVGGSGAIGRAVALGLAATGTPVAVAYAANADGARETVSQLRAAGGEAFATRLDMGDFEAMGAVVDDAAQRLGGLSTLVLAASPTNYLEFVSRTAPEQYAEQLRVDSGGTFAAVRAALPHLRRTRGSLVAVTTVANRSFVLRDVLSTGPKAANEALVRAVAVEEGRFGVRANAVGVGILGEGMTETLLETGDIRPGDLDHARGRIPLRELGRAQDVAAVVCFLASEAARYVTGQWIDVDGGYSL